MQFEKPASPTPFSLYAVLENETDEPQVRAWLASIAMEIPPELGIADRLEAAAASGISLQLLETSFAADVTQVTWRRNSPEPEGAE